MGVQKRENCPMPIYEYVCTKCGHAFEELIRGDEKPVCPSCGHKAPERQMSVTAGHIAMSGGSNCPAQNVCGMAGSGGCGHGCHLGH
jgi:putative FmdB family regulatory protein